MTILEATDLEKHAYRIIGVVKIKKFTYSEKLPKKCEKGSHNGAKMGAMAVKMRANIVINSIKASFWIHFGSQELSGIPFCWTLGVSGPVI